MFHSGGVLSKLAQTGSGGGAPAGGDHGGLEPKSPSARQFCDLSKKNSHFDAIWVTFRKLFAPFEKTKLLKFERIKLLSPPLLLGQVQNMLKRLYFWLNFLSDLARWGAPTAPLVAPLVRQ